MNHGSHIRISALFFVTLAFALTKQAISAPVDNGKLNVYRCTDANGKISLQDRPCVVGNQQVLEMTRPKDAELVKRPAPAKTTVVIASTPVLPASVAARPPPDLFRCTDFDGNVRDSEVFDRNPRCVPLWVLGFHTRSNACSWVEDSCVRYEGRELCNRWRERLRQAELDLRHSPSSRTSFLRSEVARIEQIVRSSCR